MAKIKLTKSERKICPEGEHVFVITEAKYDQNYGTMTVTMKTADGYTDVERYQLLTADGEPNERANSAFSFFVRTAMKDMNMDEVDTDELEGKYIKANVVHNVQPSKTRPGETVTFVNLTDLKAADESDFFGDDDDEGDGDGGMNLDDIFGK